MTDKQYLARAVELAKQSPEDVGCGTIIVLDGQIVAQEFNSHSTDAIAINHAEIKAVTAANKKTGKRALRGAVAYSSCEPCAMCLVALSYAKVERIVFNKTMRDFFPDDPQSKLDPYEFVKGLNFVPKVEQLTLEAGQTNRV